MVRIITDCSCDISAERGRTLGIDIVPLSVNFADGSYIAGVDLTNAEFYEKLAESEALPTTSQVSPQTFEDLFRRYIDAGDEVVCLFLSSKMSGTYNAATIVKNIIGSDKIYITDTLTVTFALGLLVLEAVKMRDAGLSGAEILRRVESLVPRVRLLAVISDLKYLKMGGRLSSTSAFFASILNICPMITIQDGLVETVGKARGKKAAYAAIAEMAKKEGISADYGIAFGHSNAPDALEMCHEAFAAETKRRETFDLDIGSIVGTHAGPGASGIAYIRK